MNLRLRIKRAIERHAAPTLCCMLFLCMGVMLAGHVSAAFFMLVGALGLWGTVSTVHRALSVNRARH